MKTLEAVCSRLDLVSNNNNNNNDNNNNNINKNSVLVVNY